MQNPRLSRSLVPLLVPLFAIGCGAALPDGIDKPDNSNVSIRMLHMKQSKADANVVPNATTAHLTYYGGPVISNVKIVQVLYGTGSYASFVTSTGAGSMAAFYAGVTNSAYFDWLSEYNTSTQSIGRGTFAGQFSITPSSANNGATITDAQIQAELSAQIAAGHLPANDANTLYMTYFPHGKVIDQGGSTSCSVFCAYHGTFVKGSNDVFYGVMPDMQTGSGCESGCGNGTPYNNLCSVSSHEMIEAVTDAAVGLATTYAAPLAWYDQTNGEIGDICNASQGTVTGGDGVTYTVQNEWSNQSNACIATRTTAGNDFSVSATPASVSIAQGGSGSSTIKTTIVSGSAQTVALSVTGAPAGVTATLSPTSVSAGQSATLSISSTSSAAAGNYTLTVKGTATSGSHTATVALTITSGGTTNDFSISASPSSVSVAAGSSAASTIGTATVSGSAQTISFSASGLPAGVTAAFSPSSATSGSSSTVTFTASSTAAAANATVTITGTAASGSHTTSIALTVTAGSTGGVTTLNNGVAVTGLSGATNAQSFFVLNVPAGQASVVFTLSGGTGDADMYVQFGSKPTLTTYQCRPYVAGNAETCTFSAPAAGAWYVMLNGYAAYTGVSLKGQYSGDSTATLTSGVPVTGISGAVNSQKFWKITVPSGKTLLTVKIAGGSGDADLYVKKGQKPSTSSYDCRPYLVGNNESCSFSSPGGNDYYIMLNGYTAYSSTTLTGTYQ